MNYDEVEYEPYHRVTEDNTGNESRFDEIINDLIDNIKVDVSDSLNFDSEVDIENLGIF